MSMNWIIPPTAATAQMQTAWEKAFKDHFEVLPLSISWGASHPLPVQVSPAGPDFTQHIFNHTHSSVVPAVAGQGLMHDLFKEISRLKAELAATQAPKPMLASLVEEPSQGKAPIPLRALRNHKQRIGLFVPYE